MKEIQDTLQVGIANGSAIALSITECNQMLTLVSLILAIAFTIYKFVKFNKANDGESKDS
jgi:tetrahydromethanopterin S-methyltransferase subunit C